MSYLFRVFLPESLWLVCSGAQDWGGSLPFRTGAKWKGLPLALVRVMPCGKTEAVKEPFWSEW